MLFFSTIEETIGVILGLIVAITVHEASHALVADRLGDPTPRLQGRLTLNPLAHLDPIGTLLLVVARFGWGKPVQFDPFNLKDPQKDSALISLAGPAANIATASLIALVFRLTEPLAQYNTSFITVFLLVAVLNINLAVFNLIPIPPLDGSKFLAGVLPRVFAPLAYSLEQYGFFVLIGLLFFFPAFLPSIMLPITHAISRLLFGGIFL